MTEQLDLFSNNPYARADESPKASDAERPIAPAYSRQTDGDTCHEAAARLNRSGRCAANERAVMDCVCRLGGQTACEIGHRTGLGHVEAQRRLSGLSCQLTNMGKSPVIKKGARKLCPIRLEEQKAEVSMVTWWLTGFGLQIMREREAKRDVDCV